MVDEEWLKEVEEMTIGAFKLKLSSMHNPTHPDNLKHYERFKESAYDVILRLISTVRELQAQLAESSKGEGSKP